MVAGPDFIKDKSQKEFDDKSIKVDSQQLDALLELKFKTYIAEDKAISAKYGAGAKLDLKDQKKREDLQKDFNDYIDKERNKVEKSEIDKAVQSFQFELNTLQTEIEIGALQQDVIAGNINSGESNTDIKFESPDIQNVKIYNPEKIKGEAGSAHVHIAGNVEEIALHNPSFGNELINLLKQANEEYKKTPSKQKSDNILEFQQKILSELSKYKQESDYPLSAGEEKYLSDGKFGEKTYKALQFLAQKTVSSASSDKTADKTADKASDKASDKSADKTADKAADKASDKTADKASDKTADKLSLTEVTDKSEQEKITNKQFDIPEFKRGKIQKDANGNYYAQINATIDGTDYDFTKTDLLKFDKDGNLLPDQLIKTDNKERETLYFVDENKIKFVDRYTNGMYLTKDSITGVTPTEQPENINYDYTATEFSLLESKRTEYEFQDLGYQALEKHPKLKDIMDKIIGEEEGNGNLGKRKFKINLSPNDGLAKIILDIYSKDSKNSPAKLLQNKKGTIGVDDIKTCFPYYKRAGGLDNEKRKIAMILNQAEERDLKNFASDAQSYGEDYEDKFEKAEKFDQVIESLSEENILQALCDYNVDGQLSAVEGNTQLKQKFLTEKGGKYPGWREDFREYKTARKSKNKEFKKDQESIGDTGTIFGPQLYHELQRAIAVMDVKLKYEPDVVNEYLKKYNLENISPKPVLTGENIVITNIIRNISWTSSNKILEQALDKVPANQRTKAKLLEMAKNYTGKEGMENNGNFQPLFSKAIEEINGSSSAISPDLFDNLVGVERIDTSYNRYSMIEKELEAYLNKNPTESAKFKSDGFTDGKHTFITGLMSVLDNLHISVNPTSISVGKSRDMEKYKHKIENSFAKDLIGGGLSVQKNGTIGLSLSTGKKGFSEDGKFQRERNTGAGVKYNNTTKTLSVGINAGGESAREYNYDKVVTGRLDDIKSAKYVGVGGNINAGMEVGGTNNNVGAMAGVEIDWKQNPKQAIEQMNRQYRDLSNGIFHLPTSAENLKDSASLEAYLLTRLNKLKNSAKEPMKTFVKNNEGFLQGNIKNIADYFDKKGIFAMINNMPEEFKGDKKRNAINNLMQVLQTGIVDSRRDYMYDQIHGKVSITKIGLGVGIGLSVGSDGISYRVPFPTLSFDISTWRKNYVSSVAGKYMDQKIIRNGEIQGHSDEFEPKGNDLNAYAEYIKARYNNLPGLEVAVNEGKFEFTYSDPSGGSKQIGDVLDIRAKLDQKVLDNIKYSDDGSVLTIGNVGDLGIFSSADGQGVRNFLIIGQKGTVDKNDKPNTFILKPPHPGSDYQGEIKDIQPIKIEKSKDKKAWTYEDIQTLLNTTFKAEKANYPTKIEDIKTEILGQIREISGNLFINGLNGKYGLSKFPTTGTVEFKKDHKGNISIYSLAEPKDKLNITYKKYTKEIIPSKIIEGTNYYDFKNVFNFTDIDALFSDPKVLDNLSKLEDNKINKLNDFLYNAGRDVDADLDIDEVEYNASSGILKELLGKNYTKITEILESGNISSKVLVINRMKGIFATENLVTNGKKLNDISKGRGESYKKLSGPSNDVLPYFTTDYRKSILDKLSSQTNISQNIDNGLVGYTAFYRKGTNTGRGFSLTAPGATKVLGGEKIPFEKEDEKLARDRFIKNFEKDKASLAIITKSINDKLPKGLTPFSDTDAIKLLSGESLDIGGENNITISLNSAMSFYLLGECANESIGIKIDGIKIKSKRGTGLLDEASESYVGDILPQDNYIGGIDVSSRNLSVPMVPGAYQHDVRINASGKDRERKAKDKTNPGIEPGDGTEPGIGGGDGTEPGIGGGG
ncbi:MAG: hypothetical protein WAZ12_05200 [Candidatus Absconditicoccaceae bacterium]